MIFAESTPAEVGTWFNNLALFISVAANVGMVIHAMRVQKREVRFYPEPASKEEFTQHVANCEKDFDYTHAGLAQIRADAKTEQADVHTRITEVSNKVSALEAGQELENQRLTQMDAKLDRLIERRH